MKVGYFMSVVRLVHNEVEDARARRSAMRHISIFADSKEKYDCPDCKIPMDRAHIHGWFWRCDKCKKEFPRYVLEKETKRVKGGV